MSMEEERNVPTTMPHTFALNALANHFNKNPLPSGACGLIDLPPDDFLPTEEEISLIAASLWVLSVKYDNLPQEERPASPEGITRWITKHRSEAMTRLANKVEPPFTAFTMNQASKDVEAMMAELLVKSLPPPPPTPPSPAQEKTK